MPVCDLCGKIVKDIRKHRERGRCEKKGGKGLGKPARFVPGTPENRLALNNQGDMPPIWGRASRRTSSTCESA